MKEEEKACIDCKEIKNLNDFNKEKKNKDGFRGQCRKCRKAYLIKNAEEIRVQRRSLLGKAARKRSLDKYPNAKKSRQFYNNHKRYIKINIPDNCQVCGESATLESHHIDYDLPLDVIYLCNKCHRVEHRNHTPLNRESGIFTKEES